MTHRVVGLVVALSLLLVAGYALWRLREDALRNALDTAEIHTRALENALTEGLRAVDVVASGIPADEGVSANFRRIEQGFREALRLTPFLRSMSLLDGQGRVIASSNPANLGQVLGSEDFLPGPPGGQEVLRLGRPWLGRDFADGHALAKGQVAGGEGLNFIPVLRALDMEVAELSLLVALNADYFANLVGQHLGPDQGLAEVLRFDGTVLMSSGGSQEIGAVREFVTRDLNLNEVEAGSYTGPPGGRERLLAAYRSSKAYPFLVVTRIQEGHALGPWLREVKAILGLVALTLGALFGLALALYRRQEELAQQRGAAARLAQINASVFSASTDAIIIADPAGKVLTVNGAFTAITGFGAEEVRGRNPWELLSPGDGLEAPPNLDVPRLLEQGTWSGEVVARHRDGGRLEGEGTVFVARGGEGHIQYIISVFHDVTEARRAQRALIQAGEKNTALLRSASDGVHILDAQGNLVEMSDSFAEMLGYGRDELLGRNVRDWDAQLSPEELEARVRTGIAQGSRFMVETRHRRKGGEVFDVEVSVLPLNIDGEPLLFCASRDVSEARRLAADLNRREQYQRALLDNFPFPVWLKDQDSRFLAVNQPMAEACGLGTPDRLIGKSDLDIWPADLAAAYRRDDLAVIRSGQARMGEEDLEVDGQRVCYETYKSPVRVAADVVGTVGFARDISRRKRVEAELAAYRTELEHLVEERTRQWRATEERASLILQSTADALFGVDVEGCITFVNHAACKLLGYGAEDLIGRQAHARVHHSRPDGTPYPAEECPTHRAVRTGEALRADDEVYWHADGHPIPVMYSVHPMRQGEQVVGAVVSVVDISARRAADAAREKALAAAEHLAGVRSQFLANMSHEIRTPLHGVLGFAGIGLRNADKPDKVREVFAKIQASGQILLGVINDILDFSKIEAGKMSIATEPLDLVDTLESAASVMAPRARAKGLDLHIRVALDLPRHCLGDRLRLSQVLLNLLSNAVKFTARGSVTLGAEAAGGRLLLRVADTGIGMDREALGRIFDPFAQADASTTRRFGGTGLGLTIARRIVELMGGQLNARSNPGAGSVFEVDLPLVPAAAARPPPEVKPAARLLAGLKVLLAEDNEVNRLIIEEDLREAGAELVTVEDGRAAVERVRGDGPQAYDLVLMDIQMPVMDGYEAARQIRGIAPCLPIVGQTAHGYGEEMDRCFAAGMVAHIAKPIDRDALVLLILREVMRARGKPA